MNRFPEYEQHDGIALAGLVQRKQITPIELCEAAIERIEWLDSSINSVVTPLFDDARKSAWNHLCEAPEPPFCGVPFLLKDLDFDYAGAPMTSGCKALKEYLPDRDSELVKRFKTAGVLIVGKTNTPEFGLVAVTEPELFGPCRNPWNLNFTPGGSSGGSAAAVAAGIVPMAAAVDYGGSLRIPAAYCGLFGLKPSRGRNPTTFDQALGASQSHIITRSVRDSAAMLDATCGPSIGAPYLIQAPKSRYLSEVRKKPGRLRIAFNTKSPISTPVHPECIRTVEHAAHILEKLGHHVEEAGPDIDGPAMTRSYLAMNFGEVAANIKNMEIILKRKVKAVDMEPLTWILGLMGQSHSAGYMVRALRQWDRTACRMGDFFQTYDIYITPTTADPPARIGEMNPKKIERILMKMVDKIKLGRWMPVAGLLDQMAKEMLKRTPFTLLANLCGLPAMSLPLYWTTEGLPIGTQFIGPFGREDRLFRLAGQLERVQPWFHRRPSLRF